jgi:hypothetical protein
MRVTATKLRQNVYAILDQVAETGVPVEVERKGKILKIVPEKRKTLEERFPKRESFIIGDPADLATVDTMDWMKEWREPELIARMNRERGERERRERRPRK